MRAMRFAAALAAPRGKTASAHVALHDTFNDTATQSESTAHERLNATLSSTDCATSAMSGPQVSP